MGSATRIRSFIAAVDEVGVEGERGRQEFQSNASAEILLPFPTTR